MNKKMVWGGLALFSIVVIGLVVFNVKQNNTPQTIIIGSTTSLNDSGLLDQLLPEFTKDTGIETKLIAVGTGQALQMGVDGEVDVVLVHSKAAELDFIKNGDGIKRYFIMFNDFVLVGPIEDPLKIKEQAGEEIKKAFEIINAQNGLFVSRGDDSGTNKKELAIWKSLEITPSFSNYINAGSGMGEVLKMADEKQAYTLSDRGTFDKMSKDLSLAVVCEGEKTLLNEYGAIAVNPNKNDRINNNGANALIKWLLSEKVQKEIGEYGKEITGKSLFYPTYEKYE